MKHYLENKRNVWLQGIVALFLVAGLLLTWTPCVAKAAESGTCGTNVNWSLNDDGELRITGTGSMSNFSESEMAPWYPFRDSITAIYIEEGITNIGHLAFYECANVNRIAIPNSVTKIGSMAFAGCSSLYKVTLGSGIVSIGSNAFARCESLATIHLPEGLVNIGAQAFYRCTSLSTLRVPATTTNLGESAFAYCDNLMQVIIEGSLRKLPEWIFYGCDSLVQVVLPATVVEVGEYAFYECDALQNIYHGGGKSEREQFIEELKEELPEFNHVAESKQDTIISSSSTTVTQDDKGNITTTDREVVDTGSGTIDITINHSSPSKDKEEYQIEVDATIEQEEGWNQLIDYVDDYITLPNRVENEALEVDKIQMQITLNNSTQLPGEVLSQLAGQKVNVTIITGDKSQWSIDCENLQKGDLTETYNLNYTLVRNTEPTNAQKKLIGEATSFILTFEEDIPFEVTVTIPLGYSYRTHFASICQKVNNKKWEMMQSVVIDTKGNANFYLGALDNKTEYLVAINVSGITLQDATLPDDLEVSEGTLTDAAGNKYVITGTRSSIGVSFGQLNLILAGIIVVSIAAVFFVIRLQYKMKAQREAAREIYKREPKRQSKRS